MQILSTDRYFPQSGPGSFVHHSLIFFSRKVLNIVVAGNFLLRYQFAGEQHYGTQ